MAQSLLSKYVWIIDTIYKADRISFKELNSLWLDSEISEGVEIPKRTFDNWRYAIQDMFGLFIENEGKGKYRYYIMNKEDISKNGLRSWIYNTFCVSNALDESQSIKDRILLEYVPSGQEYLQKIIEAMKSNQILNITYHSYWKDEENNFDVEPFCVKLFRQRWWHAVPIPIITNRDQESIASTVLRICKRERKHLKCLKVGQPKSSSTAALES